MNEKRRSTRLDQDMPIRKQAQNGESIEVSKAKDISTGGLRIATDAPLDIGTKLNIEVNIDGSSNPYYAIGEVVWFKEKADQGDKNFDMGIRFVRIVTKADLEGFE